MKDGKIMLIEVDNTQMAIIKSWNSMKYDRRKNMMIGDCSKELLDKLSKIVRLPPAIESYRQRLDAIIVRAQRLGCGAHLAGDTRISLNQLMLAIYGKNMLGYTSDRLIRYGLPVKWHVVKKNRFRVIDIDAFWKERRWNQRSSLRFYTSK